MSVGNTKTNGNKGNNFPFQLAVLKLLDAIATSVGSIPGIDYETRTTLYQATAGGPGYSIGDFIVRYDIIDVATSTVISTIWFNQTTQATIAAPAPANITPIVGPTSVMVNNGPGGAAVNIQDGGNSITVDSFALDVALSTRNAEATQLLIHALLTTIDGDTSNLDVLLSTRASEATLLSVITALGNLATEATLLTRLSKADFEARINTLGQKTMALSTPVVIASNQSALPVTGPLTDAELRAVPVPVSGSISVSNFPATQPISAVTLPLPTGAATAANQATEIASLASIDAGIPAALGQTTMAASMPVVIASNQTTLPITSIKLQSYSASIVGLVPGLLPTDIFTITGSATKIVKIRVIRVTATRTASTTSDLLIVKRSTANTLGTSTAPTRVPNDSTNAAATATVLAYTANPTLGALVGNFRARKMFINTAGAGASDITSFDFDSEKAQAPTLNGVSEVFAVNLNGVTVTGGNFDIAIEWTEE